MWTSVDPVGQDFNPYAYCSENPIIIIDKDGKIWGAIIGAVVGAYAMGALANQNANPFEWNYNNLDTWTAMLGGAALGASLGNSIEQSIRYQNSPFKSSNVQERGKNMLSKQEASAYTDKNGKVHYIEQKAFGAQTKGGKSWVTWDDQSSDYTIFHSDDGSVQSEGIAKGSNFDIHTHHFTSEASGPGFSSHAPEIGITASNDIQTSQFYGYNTNQTWSGWRISPQGVGLTKVDAMGTVLLNNSHYLNLSVLNGSIGPWGIWGAVIGAPSASGNKW